MFEAAQGPAAEGAPNTFDPLVLSGFRAAGRPGGSHPAPKPGVSKGHLLGMTGAALLTSERQPGREEGSLAPGLMWVG